MKLVINKFVFFLVIPSLMVSCFKNVTVSSGNLQIEFNNEMLSRVNSTSAKASTLQNSFLASEFIETNNMKIDRFDFQDKNSTPVHNQFGDGAITDLKGNYKTGDIELQKIITISVFDSLPDIAIMNTRYVNTGNKKLYIKKWVNNRYILSGQGTAPYFWSFQGSSTSERKDWVLPLESDFINKNFMGMNDSDYGGGIPVLDVWRKDIGIAIGHLSIIPREVSLPVMFDSSLNQVTIGIEQEFSDYLELNAGDTLNTLETFVSIHSGDYFNSLKRYSEIMQTRGLKFAGPEEQAFEPIWCGWGYGRKFTVDEIIGTLPKVKEMGIKWAVIDDGFQISEGDWRVDESRFPGGDNDMEKMVDAIHASGLKAKLWWAPLAADPGSKILKDDPDVLLINSEGSPQYISWWDSYYLSPAYSGTISYTKATVEKFMKDWGFDGLKLDGQHMNAVPADYNWSRPLEYPEKSIEELPQFFKMIYETAREIKPNAVVENCPCGCCMSIYNMPFTNQAVASDPTSSWQIRLKGKTYKAIMPQTAYYGDHVELSDNGDDFASSFGIGAVLGTKFTWPKDNPLSREILLLTPEKEMIYKKWFSLYNEKMLSKEEYIGDLYDIGYDVPETHVIRKGTNFYYAFYNEAWKDKVSLRGLDQNTSYHVYDYFNDKDLGTVNGDAPELNVAIDGFLLIEVKPEKVKDKR